MAIQLSLDLGKRQETLGTLTRRSGPIVNFLMAASRMSAVSYAPWTKRVYYTGKSTWGHLGAQ